MNMNDVSVFVFEQEIDNRRFNIVDVYLKDNKIRQFRIERDPPHTMKEVLSENGSIITKSVVLSDGLHNLINDELVNYYMVNYRHAYE